MKNLLLARSGMLPLWLDTTFWNEMAICLTNALYTLLWTGLNETWFWTCEKLCTIIILWLTLQLSVFYLAFSSLVWTCSCSFILQLHAIVKLGHIYHVYMHMHLVPKSKRQNHEHHSFYLHRVQHLFIFTIVNNLLILLIFYSISQAHVNNYLLIIFMTVVNFETWLNTQRNFAKFIPVACVRLWYSLVILKIGYIWTCYTLPTQFFCI